MMYCPSGFTALVSNLSSRTTVSDLTTFFSYCGGVDEIFMFRDNDQSQMAFVTFKQPFALDTAILLNDAVILGRRIRIVPLKNVEDLCISTILSNVGNKTQNLVPAASSSLIPYSMLNGILSRAQDLQERYSITDRGGGPTKEMELALSSAKQAASHVGSAAALWLYNMAERAADCTSNTDNKKRRKKFIKDIPIS